MTMEWTYLFVPGNNSKRVAKALVAGADVVLLDLEDAVALGEKETARAEAVAALSMERKGRVFVRVNGLGTPYCLADLAAVVVPGLDGIMLPKTESREDVIIADWVIGQLERQRGITPGTVELLPLVETAAGVERSLEIARASSRVCRLAFGAIDYTLDIGTGLSKGGSELFYARSKLVNTSRLAGIAAPIDTVYPDVRDLEGLAADCAAARQLGMGAKLVIHPDQIPLVRETFAPGAAEIAWAKKVVAAFAAAEADGVAAIAVDGKFIDYPVAARAKQIVAAAEALGL